MRRGKYGVTQGAPPVSVTRTRATRVAWASAMANALASRLSPSPQRDEIVRVMGKALAPATADSYGGHLSRFVAFCAAQPDRPSPLPATTDTVLRWLAGEVCAHGKVKAGSLQPYLSAINRIHSDMGFDTPAVGHLVESYKSGLAHDQTEQGRPSERVYLPPPVVEQILEWALRVELQQSGKQLQLEFRAAVAVVFTYCFFARGATGAALLSKHVRRGPHGELLITLDHEKGRAKRARSRLLTVPAASIAGLDELLAKWEAFRGEVRVTDSYYALPFEVLHARTRSVTYASTQIDTWLQLVLKRFGVAAPPGEIWSGHSLRKGAASGAAAILVGLERVCHMGGWSVHSSVVKDYIDVTCPPTSACYRFFGWLLPPAMRV